MRVDSFLIKDFFNAHVPRSKGGKIGWVVPQVASYKNSMASTRIRVYDVVKYLNSGNSRFISTLYRKRGNYDIVVFQKAFGEENQERAIWLKNKNVKIIFDINVNYVTDNASEHPQVSAKQADDVRRMISIADGVMVTTPYLYDVYKKYHSNVALIEESIPQNFFDHTKQHAKTERLTLVYCGYAVKAAEIKSIATVLNKLKDKVKLLTVCDKDPKLEFTDYEYVNYNIDILPELLVLGDVGIAPRDLTLEYNLGHAFTKIGYLMAVGLNVLASPVPSYMGSPAIICETLGDWEGNLNSLLESHDKRNDLAKLGVDYCRDNYSMEVIGGKYTDYFNTFMG